MKDGLVAIASFPEPLEANLLRSKLLSEGIECILLDENLISVQPFYSNAIGGIKLLVHENDTQRAKEILNESNKSPLHIIHNADEIKRRGSKDKAIHCSVCNSKDVYYEHLSTGEIALCILFIGIPLLFIKGKYHCYNCGFKWKGGEEIKVNK